MAAPWVPNVPFIKIEDSPSPEPSANQFDAVPPSQNIPPHLNGFVSAIAATTTAIVVADPSPAIDPRDPEGFLKRCAGFNKKTRVRCNSVIGKKSEQSCHPTFLPTCRAHRDQQSFAGWCQYQRANGERCSRLFRWTPPYFELCSEHQGHPDTPCYFMKLPLELRHEVFRYLLPDQPIGSTTATLHRVESIRPRAPNGARIAYSRAELNRQRQMPMIPTAFFPVPLLNLYLVSRQFHQEVKDLLFSIAPFIIDVRKDGTFMCGRRLLEPRRADGSSHFLMDEVDEAKQRFLKHFDWSAVKHYIVDILIENGANGSHSTWDEEVELYDIRDYISVVVSGVLAKSRNLCKLNVRLCLANFPWSHEQTLANTKLIVGPFESLRNVRQPQIQGVYMGVPIHNSMLHVPRQPTIAGSPAPVCSVPPLPTQIPVLVPGMPEFDTYASAWSRWISSPSATALVPKAPIRSMFTAFKDFYSELSSYVPEVTYIAGRKAFLHRARVAREQENVEAFRALRNEAITYWSAYLDREERKKNAMDAKMGRMLDMDVYPSHEWEDHQSTHNNNKEGAVKLALPPSKPGPSASHIDKAKRPKHCDEAIFRTHHPKEMSETQQCKQEVEDMGAQNAGLAQQAQQYYQHQRALAQVQAQLQQQRQRQAARTQHHLVPPVCASWQIQLHHEMTTAAAEVSGNVPLPDRFPNSPSSSPATIFNAPSSSSPTISNPSPLTTTFTPVNTSMTFTPANTSTSAHLYSTADPNTNPESCTSLEHHINETDVGYALLNLSSGWYTQDMNAGSGDGGEGAGPGPSSEMSLKRRVDSGFCEMDFTMETGEAGAGGLDADVEVEYVGKGKGKMGGGVREVICID